MEIKRAIVVIVLVFIGASALCGLQNVVADDGHPKIDRYLQSILKSTPDNQMVDSYVVLKDRLSYEQVASQTIGLKRKQRQKTVAEILKQHSQITQRNIMAFLQSAESQGVVEQIRKIWLVNVIAFRAQPSAIYQIAENFAEIEKIFYDPKYPVEELVDDNGITKYNEENNLYFYGGNRSPQPGLTLINAPQVWAEGDSGQGVLVGNIDTGTDWTHPDLANNIWNNLGEDADGDGRTMEYTGSTWIYDPGDINNVDDDGNGYIDDFIGWDYSGNDNDPSNGSSHGTATSGIVAGDGTNGTETGVAPKANLIILKPSGESQYWQAQQYALDKGADVVTSSLSYKWYFNPPPNYPVFRQATDMELAAGMFHSNSTSNDGSSVGVPFNISAPGNCPPAWLHPDQTLVGGLSSVTGSANVNASSDIIVSSSPWGPAAWEDFQINHPSYPYPMPPQYQDYPYETQPGSIGLLKPDVAAPGNGTTSTAPGGGYQSFSGTSGATPHIAGTAALILSTNPDLNPGDVSRILQTTAVEKGAPGKDERYGAGRIDAYAAHLQAFAEAGTPLVPVEFAAYSDYSMPTSMDLTWNDPTNLINGDTLLTGYFSILISRDGVLIDSVASDVESFTDNGLTDGVEYTYQISAKVDSTGKQSDPVETSWIAGGSPIPDPPAQFGISNQQDQVTLYWTNPNTNIDGTPMDDLAGLNVYQGTSLLMTLNRTSADSGALDSVTFTPSTTEALNWYMNAFDDESPSNESAYTDTVIVPLNFPILENFAADGIPNPVVWKNAHADINDRAVNMPSEPYSLNFNGVPVGGDTIESYPIDLGNSQGSGIVFSYLYQPQGSGNSPEPNDSLRVYFMNDLGEWILVRGYPGTTLHDFQHEIIDIEAEPNGTSFLHSQFQIRIKGKGSVNPTIPNDDWFVDNIYLGLSAPAIAVSNDSLFFDSTLVGSSSTIQIDVQNVGVQPLIVSQVIGAGGVFTVDTTSFLIDPAKAQSLNITFVPQGPGNVAGWIQIVSNDPSSDTLRVYVEGIGKQITGIAESTGMPKTYAVNPNYPNPFNPTTTIKYQLPQSSDVTLTIYNVLGQKVRRLLNQSIEAGYHSVVWDGRNDSGIQASSGIYIYQFRATTDAGEINHFVKTQKMILMK